MSAKSVTKDLKKFSDIFNPTNVLKTAQNLGTTKDVIDFLFPKEETAPAQPTPEIPTREDAVTNVLSQQLEELRKRRARLLGGVTSPSNGSTPANLASTTLFGE